MKARAVKSGFATGFLNAARNVWATKQGFMSAVNIAHDRLLIFLTKILIEFHQRRMRTSFVSRENFPGFLSLTGLCLSKQQNSGRADRSLMSFMKTPNRFTSRELERMFSDNLANYQVFVTTSFHWLSHHRPPSADTGTSRHFCAALNRCLPRIKLES